MEKYIPCPVCHDIGGGGKIDEWQLPTGFKLYVCDECESAWNDLYNMPLENVGSAHLMIKAEGFDINELMASKEIKVVRPVLFKLNDAELTDLTNTALQMGSIFFEGPYSRRIYWDTGTPIGINGEDILVVIQSLNNELIGSYPANTIRIADHESQSDTH
jgi:hypothetical protein